MMPKKAVYLQQERQHAKLRWSYPLFFSLMIKILYKTTLYQLLLDRHKAAAPKYNNLTSLESKKLIYRSL